MNTANDPRRRDLATIHIAAKQLGMDRETYEAMLWAVARVHSAKDLDDGGRKRVLEHLRAVGFKARRPGSPHPGRPHNLDGGDRGGQLKKIEAMLTAAGRPWAYADGMAKRMCHVDRVTFCNPEQLGKIIAALVYDAKRHGRRT